MPFQISITTDAEAQMRALPAHRRRVLEAAIVARLVDRPTIPTRAIKRLRPNPFAEYELRVGDLRVLYNVNVGASEVVLLVIGRKDGNKLIIGGIEFHGHQDNPAEPTGGGPTGDAD